MGRASERKSKAQTCKDKFICFHTTLFYWVLGLMQLKYQEISDEHNLYGSIYNGLYCG